MSLDQHPSFHSIHSILFLRSSQYCTGLERRILLTAGAARDAGFVPHIGVLYRLRPGLPATHPLIEQALRAGISATQIADASPLAPRSFFQLRDVIRKIKPAIIHTNDYRTDVLAFLAVRLSRFPARLVATCHGHVGADWKLRFYEAIDRVVLRHFDRVIGVSQYQCRLLREWGLDKRRIAYIPNPVEPGWEQATRLPGVPGEAHLGMRIVHAETREIGQPQTPIRLGFFGRHSPEKGLDVLLAALPRVQALYPQTELLVAGDIPLGKAPAGVHLVGHQENIRALMSTCDVIVVPSRREAFGLVALEALALGRPVIATAVGGLPELIRDGETGRLVPPDDPEALAKAIIETVANWPASSEMALRGQKDVLKRYQACEILESVVALYKDLLGGGEG